jgi:hypothetical protein
MDEVPSEDSRRANLRTMNILHTVLISLRCSCAQADLCEELQPSTSCFSAMSLGISYAVYVKG